ncbi:MAG: cytochrome c-type biogenesis protein CcmH, partial [Bryobacteraceae bacterium]
MQRRVLVLSLLTAGAVPCLFASPAKGDPRLERLFAKFLSPCCWSESLMIHNSPKADELRREIQSMISASWSDDDIKRDLIARYSTRILVVPEGTAGTWLTWTPWALTAAGLFTVAAVIRSSVR